MSDFVPPSAEVQRAMIQDAIRRSMERLRNRTLAELAQAGYERAAVLRAMMADPSIAGNSLAERLCVTDIRAAQPLSPYSHDDQTVVRCKPCAERIQGALFLHMLIVSSGARCADCDQTAEEVINRDGMPPWREPAGS